MVTNRPTRRRALGLAGTSALSLLAGCMSGIMGGLNVTTDEHSPTEAPTERPSPSPEPTPASYPSHLHGLSGSTTPSGSTDPVYSRTFSQQVGGRVTTLETEIPKILYQYYQNRIRVPQFGCYVSDGFDDFFIESLAQDFQEFGERNNLSQSEVVNHAIAFTQGMEYTNDVAIGFDEYPRYPVETLVDRGGDCEDTSILMASILEKLGFESVLLLLPEANHMAVGILGRESIPGAYYTRDGDRFYYVETTGTGWRVGQIPPEIEKAGADARLLDIDAQPVLVYTWEIRTPEPGEVLATLTVNNVGKVPATTGEILIEIEDRQERTVSEEREGLGTLEPESPSTLTVSLPPPPDDRDLRARVSALLDGQLHDRDTSEFRDLSEGEDG